MTTQTTRTKKYIKNETVLFLTFELGAKEWKLGFSTGWGQKARRRGIRGGDLEKLQKEITAAKKRFGLGVETPLMSCYEAGRDEFWLHRYLSHAHALLALITSPSPRPSSASSVTANKILHWPAFSNVRISNCKMRRCDPPLHSPCGTHLLDDVSVHFLN